MISQEWNIIKSDRQILKCLNNISQIQLLVNVNETLTTALLTHNDLKFTSEIFTFASTRNWEEMF